MNRFSNHHGCPVELAVDLLSGKRKTVMLARLKQQPLRYGELRRQLPGIADKVLTQRLKQLEEFGLVGRADGVYRLTAKGDTMRPALQALYKLGVDYHSSR